MDEDELRAVFARHEHLTPAAEPLKAAIREGYRRRWRRSPCWPGRPSHCRFPFPFR